MAHQFLPHLDRNSSLVEQSPEGMADEAYVLCRRNDRATADFSPRITPCTVSEVSCFVTQVELLTRFAQVVDRTRRCGSRSYTEQQALKDYQQRGGTVEVQIKLVLPAAYKTDESNRNQNTPDAYDRSI